MRATHGKLALACGGAPGSFRVHQAQSTRLTRQSTSAFCRLTGKLLHAADNCFRIGENPATNGRFSRGLTASDAPSSRGLDLVSPAAHLKPRFLRKLIDPLREMLVQVIKHICSDLFLDIH